MKWEDSFFRKQTSRCPQIGVPRLKLEEWQMTYELRDVLLSAMSILAEVTRDLDDYGVLERLDVSDEHAEEIREVLEYILDRRKV
jgi:hypothetical protein